MSSCAFIALLLPELPDSEVFVADHEPDLPLVGLAAGAAPRFGGFSGRRRVVSERLLFQMEAPVVVPVPAGVEGAQAQHGLGAIETPFRASDPKAALMLALGEAWRLFARTLTKHTS